jgi:AbrB family looped-hinge helix DNA binding protein
LRNFCFSAIQYFMKATLAISSRGVLTLPAKLRRAVGISPEDQVMAETTPEGILLRPAVTLPVEIYSDDRVREFDAAEADLAKVLPAASVRKRRH